MFSDDGNRPSGGNDPKDYGNGGDEDDAGDDAGDDALKKKLQGLNVPGKGTPGNWSLPDL